ncbi:hypothetical protein G7Y89_g11016 [Cudoniella acicularis]|uniref:WD40 repeat-like protein n=1 Tax=Cudoniella acicularis TaxID=354080 RepID=A0A8H4RD55_9HELO|nr:hypothetical protein G7Y89_g11016 [Cudoniella acicularis]
MYFTTHTVDDAHITDIFSIAVTPTQILSASGASSLKVHSTTAPDIPLAQTISGAHKLGCHHIATSRNGRIAASAGFGGEVKIWSISESSEWVEEGKIVDGNKAGEIWAIALSEDGQFLASTTYDGRINVWDLVGGRKKIREYETKGSFGICIDMSRDGRFTASGHENGGVYIFNNDTGRMLYSLPGLVKPVRTVAFSPAGTRLAAAGDAKVIALFDVQHGEQVANLPGHSAWIFSVDWSDTGEYLLSGSFDGKAKVWSVDRRACVATHTETDKTLWCVKWLPKTGKSEAFATAGANKSISFYREATGALLRYPTSKLFRFTMYASSTLILGAIMALARVVVATPPACLLAALQSQSNPADLKSLCGTLQSAMQGNITAKCSGDALSAAVSAYSATCLSSESVTISFTSASSSSSSGTASATATSPGSATAKTTSSTSATATAGASTIPTATGSGTSSGTAASQTSKSGAGSKSPQFAVYLTPVVLAFGFASQYML